MAAKTGLSASFLSLLENDRTDISLSRLVRLTDVFGVQMADLFTDPKHGLVYVSRLRDARRIRTSERNVTIKILTTRRDQKLEPYVIELGPRATLQGLHHIGDEFFHVVEGKLRVTFGRNGEPLEQYVLKKSDSVYFPGNLDHSYENLHNRPTRILGAITRE